jgi:hypothetical protein
MKFFEPERDPHVRDRFTGGCRRGMPFGIVMGPNGEAIRIASPLRTEEEARRWTTRT